MRDFYTWIALLACLVNGVSALAILLRDPRNPGNRVATLLVAGGTWWSFTILLRNLTDDPAAAARYMQLSALGWAWIGPLSLHLVALVVTEPPAWVRRVLLPAYAAGAVFAILHVGTEWLQRDPVRSSWGWDYDPGPLRAVYFAFTMVCVAPAIRIGRRSLRTAPSPAERHQLRLLGIAVAAPVVIASLTGVILPLAGVAVPRLGAASFAVFGATVAYSYYRYGFSAVVPGTLAGEVLETLHDGVALLVPDGGIRSANGALARLLQLPQERLVGLSLASRLSIPLSDATEVHDVECELRAASGSVPVSVSTSRLRDKSGLSLGLVVVLRDRRELVGLRNRLVTSGRLAAVGQLAAGIAHEINNPTAYVRANLTQLRSTWSELLKRLPNGNDDPQLAELVAEGEELIEESLEGVERTAAIVRDVKGFAHRGSGILEEVDPNELLDEVLRMAQPQLREGICVEVRLSEVPKISGISRELKQVFLNLVVNAIQSIDGEGRVEVTTRREREHVCIRVTDDGCGIPPEHHDRIFDPFFTTKAVGEGTGLGLAISYQILRSHGAELTLDSEPDHGTTFTIRFRPARK